MLPMSKKSPTYAAPLFAEDPEKACTYINLTIRDAGEAIHAMVKQKIQEKQPKIAPKRFKERMAEKIATTAANKVPPSAIAKKLSEKLPKMLVYKMHQQGMRLGAQVVFIEEAYVVMQIQVQHVDSTKLLSKIKETGSQEDKESNDGDDSVATEVLDEWIEEQTKQEIENDTLSERDRLALDQAVKEQSSQKDDKTDSTAKKSEESLTPKDYIVQFLEWILTQMLPERAVEKLESEQLPSLVQGKLTENMQTMMEQKLESKQLEADVAVCGEAEQARYFYQNLKAVRERAATKKK